MASDGKAQRPEESAQREARSEHIPTPEGRGGEEHPVFKFLLGEEPLEGRWFGDDPPVINGRPRPYWWRMHLREALLSSPRVERERALEEWRDAREEIFKKEVPDAADFKRLGAAEIALMAVARTLSPCWVVEL